MDTLHDHHADPDGGPPRSGPPGGDTGAWPEPAEHLLTLGGHLAAHPGHLPHGLGPEALVQALAGLRPAQDQVERAALAVLGAARALEITWPRIGAALGLTPGGARDLYTRLGRRHTDYSQPLAPTLQAHTDRARALLDALDRPLSPGTRAIAAPRLGAVLFAGALTGADPATVRAWMDEDTLAGPARLLLGPHPVSTVDAHSELAEHASDPPAVRRGLVERMRAALPAPEEPARGTLGPAADAPPLARAPEHTGEGTGAEEDSAGAALAGLDMVIGDYVDPDGQDPTRQALHTLSEAIGSGAPELLDQAVRDVAELDPHARARALGPAGQAAWAQVHQAWSTGGLDPDPAPEPPAGLADLVARAGLPPQATESLAELRAAAAPHLARRGQTRFPVVDRLAELDRAIESSDPRALAAAVGDLPTGGRDLFDATTLAGVGEPLGEVLLALDGNAPAHQEHHPAEPAAASPESHWQSLAAAVLPADPRTAGALARLLAAADTPLSNGGLAMGSTDQRAYLALYHLRNVVREGAGAGIALALADAVAIRPTRKPVNAHPEIADALRALIDTYQAPDGPAHG